MKKILLSLILATASCLTGQADNYQYLTVNTSTGNNSIALGSVRKITFDNGNIVIRTAAGDERSYALDLLQNLSFSIEPPTGVTTLNASDNLLPIYIYNVNGQLIRQFDKSREKGQLNLRGLTQGIYIVKQGSETRKILKR